MFMGYTGSATSKFPLPGINVIFQCRSIVSISRQSRSLTNFLLPIKWESVHMVILKLLWKLRFWFTTSQELCRYQILKWITGTLLLSTTSFSGISGLIWDSSIAPDTCQGGHVGGKNNEEKVFWEFDSIYYANP